jgi:hypothetical protein
MAAAESHEHELRSLLAFHPQGALEREVARTRAVELIGTYTVLWGEIERMLDPHPREKDWVALVEEAREKVGTW